MNSIHFRPLENTDRISGTSFHHDVVYATPNELKYLLGEPTFDTNDGEAKVNMEWCMEMEDGNVLTVYDYKEYKPLHPNGQVEWHIGAHSRFDSHLVKTLLSEELQLAHDEVMRSLRKGRR